MRLTGFALIAAAAVTAGCGSLASTTGTPAAAPDPSPSAPSCTTSACLATLIGKSLIGLVAKDEAVVTKAVCRPSTLKQAPGPVWTVTCTVTESDGNVSTGYANLVVSSQTVTWDPQKVISGPDAG